MFNFSAISALCSRTLWQIGVGPFACPSFGPDSNLTVLWRSVVENTYFIRPTFLWSALATEHRSGGNSFFYFFLFLFSGFIPIAPTSVFVHVVMKTARYLSKPTNWIGNPKTPRKEK